MPIPDIGSHRAKEQCVECGVLGEILGAHFHGLRRVEFALPAGIIGLLVACEGDVFESKRLRFNSAMPAPELPKRTTFRRAHYRTPT